jgi:predicted nucleic acid-binding protein
MPKITYDTNVFIKEKPAYFPAGFFMSAVVIQELAAGARDNSRLKELDNARRRYEKESRLLVPTGEDWWFAGKILNSIARALKSKSGGRITSISKAEQQRILRDVLIARTARREGVLVVTSDISDFAKIQPYCNVRVKHPSEFIIR